MKKWKKTQRNIKTFHAHDWKNNIVKMSILSKAIYTQLEQTILKLVWQHKKNPNRQSNLEKEKQSWRHHNSGPQAI